MLNMIDTQDKLKNFSEPQLIQEMQQPSGSAPQFMVLGEIERRKRMRADMQRQQGLMQPTVAQEAVSAAGVPQQGIAQVAQSLAPKTDMTQNTGVPSAQAAGLPAQPNQPQRMADGGVLRLAPGGGLSGGTISAIANLRVKRPGIYEEYKDDPEALAMAAEYFQNVADTPERTGLESLEAPYIDPYGPQWLAQRTAAAEVGNQARMASEVAPQREIDHTFPVDVPQAKADPTYAEDEFFFNAGMFDRVAPENIAAQPRGSDIDNSFTLPTPAAAAPQAGEAGFASARPRAQGIASFGASSPQIDNDQPINYVAPPNQEQEVINELINTGYVGDASLYKRGMVGQRKAVSLLGDGELRAIAGNPNSNLYGLALEEMGRRGLDFGEKPYIAAQAKTSKAESKLFSAQERLRAADSTADKRAAQAAIEAAQAEVEAARAAQGSTPKGILGTSSEDTTPERTSTTAAEATRKRADAAEETLMAMPVTADPNKSEAQKAAEAAAAALADKVAGTDKPAGGTKGTSKKSGIAAAKSTMDQDKWLALAQAGLTLMSTGDFGKAGSAGLAAYREAQKGDREERKLDAELLLREAQMAKANRAPAAKPIPAAYLTSLQTDKEAIQLQLAGLSPPEEGGFFSGGSDPDAAARTRLEKELAAVNARINRMYSQYGLGASVPNTASRKVV